MKMVNMQPQNFKPRLKAFEYQLQAVRAIRDLEYCAIFHEQGLGKTKIAIDLLLYWLESKVIDCIIIVTKKTLVPNWFQELRDHCYLKPALLTQDKQKNFFIFNGTSRVILTNYEVIQSEFERMNIFLRALDVGIILDESTKIKNPDSTLFNTYNALAPLFKRRVIMTGTPVANRPYDIWAQIQFLDQGKSLGKDFREFQRLYDLSNEMSDSPERQRFFERNLEQLMSRISPFTVRETKQSGVITLPEKIYELIETDWEPIQEEMYKQVRDEMKLAIIAEGIPRNDVSESVIKRLLRLVQIASNPALVDPSYDRLPGKLVYLINIVRKIINDSCKCIVWTGFTENVEWLSWELKEFGASKVYGKMDIYQRDRNITKFKIDPETRILIATPGAAKEGLTLTVANYAIFYDRGFSLDDYLQAQDRIHRISQTSKCYIYSLLMKESIDEWIEILLMAKELAAKLAQGDISIDYYRSQMRYDYGQILKNILNIDNSSQGAS